MVSPHQTPSFLKASNIYFALGLAVLVGVTVYGVFQYKTYTAEGYAIQNNEQEFTELSGELENSQNTFKVFAEERSKEQLEFGKKIVRILPPDENYTEFTRQLDDYFSQHDLPGNPVFQSSLGFGKGGPLEGMEGISMLPVTMTIEATRDNFFKFLDFVESSGSLDNGVRLMEVNSIQLNFPDGGEVLKDLKQKINFTVDMSVYYQTPQ